MALRRHTHTFLLLLSLTCSTCATTEHQFRQFWPGSSWNVSDLRERNCSDKKIELYNDPKVGGYELVGCLLSHEKEIAKAIMAICAVLLGLTPTLLLLIGPKITDISTVALNRPFLALMVTIGSPAIVFGHEETGTDYVGPDEEPPLPPLWPAALVKPHSWKKWLVSILEYGFVGLAAGNAVYQGYNLSFRAVALVSTITGTFGRTQEAFSPLVWTFLAIPIQAISVAAVCLSTTRTPRGITNVMPVSGILTEEKPRARGGILRWIYSEFTPCAWADPVEISQSKLEIRERYILLFLNWAIKILSWMHIIYSIVILSSIIFLDLWDTLEVVARVLCGAIVCRLVIAFEIHGLLVSSSPLKHD